MPGPAPRPQIASESFPSKRAMQQQTSKARLESDTGLPALGLEYHRIRGSRRPRACPRMYTCRSTVGCKSTVGEADFDAPPPDGPEHEAHRNLAHVVAYKGQEETRKNFRLKTGRTGRLGRPVRYEDEGCDLDQLRDYRLIELGHCDKDKYFGAQELPIDYVV